MDKKRALMDEISQKIADTELAFEYELGVEYQKQLIKHRENLLKQLTKVSCLLLNVYEFQFQFFFEFYLVF